METEILFHQLKDKLKQLADANHLLSEQVTIAGKDLTVEEAIGKPHRQDYPLQKGKDKLLQAIFKDAAGQAFTDQGGYFRGTLAEVLDWPLQTNFDRAVFVACLNAVLRYLGLIQQTVHCKDEEPEECAAKIVPLIRQDYGNPNIAQVGFQPALLGALAAAFPLRVLDLDPDRIGTNKNGIKVEDGEGALADVLDWADLVLATGSTITNGTICNFLDTGKPVIFYGTTIAGAAYLMGWKRYCGCAR